MVDLGKKYKVTVFRGSETNLLERYYYAAKDNNISTIVRLPGDNPTPEPSEIDRIINYHKISNNDEVFVFNGWTFSSSPSVQVFDHPVYDLWILKCY